MGAIGSVRRAYQRLPGWVKLIFAAIGWIGYFNSAASLLMETSIGRNQFVEAIATLGPLGGWIEQMLASWQWLTRSPIMALSDEFRARIPVWVPDAVIFLLLAYSGYRQADRMEKSADELSEAATGNLIRILMDPVQYRAVCRDPVEKAALENGIFKGKRLEEVLAPYRFGEKPVPEQQKLKSHRKLIVATVLSFIAVVVPFALVVIAIIIEMLQSV